MFTEDHAAFFADFGVPVTLAGVAVRCIFDAAYEPANVGLLGMASAQPMLTIASASVPADPVGTGVTVRGVAYVVAASEPDGTGITRVMLERAP